MGLKRRTKNGTRYWVVTYGLHHADNGKPRYRERWFRRRDEAQRFDMSQQEVPQQAIDTATVANLADVWLTEHVTGLSQRTQRDYRLQVEKRINPHLGGTKVERLTPRQVTTWLKTIGTEHTRSANKALGVLKAMLRWGRANGYTTTRAADDVKRLKAPPPKAANPWTPAEVEELAEAMPGLRDRTIIYLAAYSGLRFSELRALRWQDVDLDEGVVHVAHSLDLDGSLKPPKSHQERSLPILRPGLAALREWRDATTGTDFIFRTRHGGTLSKDWYKTVHQVTGRRVYLHELRDTYASILIAAGIGEMELTMWLGHTSVELTRRRYARLYASRQSQIADAANRVIDTL